jgi:hypothetical protein
MYSYLLALVLVVLVVLQYIGGDENVVEVPLLWDGYQPSWRIVPGVFFPTENLN